MKTQQESPMQLLRWALLCLSLPASLASAQSPGPTPPAPKPAAGSLRIGAWNIEHLGTRKPPQKPADLVDYLVTSGVDVLALEEIHDDDQKVNEDPPKDPFRNAILDASLPLLKDKTKADWEYTLTEPSAANKRVQMTGVLWRKDRVTMSGRFRLGVKGGIYNNNPKLTLWTRHPEAFLFHAGQPADKKTDFVLIPLHMKSNSDGEAGKEMREIEARQLIDALPGLAKQWKNEKDIVLLGDANIMAGEKQVQTVWKDWRDLNAADVNTYFDPKGSYPPAPFDRVFVPAPQKEFGTSSQGLHGRPGPGGKPDPVWIKGHHATRSDHLLVWADLKVSPDDD
jgi:hypothetical protein